MRVARVALVSLSLVAGCGTAAVSPDAGSMTSSIYVAGFNPPAVESGYTRYMTPTLKQIPSGADIEYCSYVTLPSTSTQDVLNVVGSQSKTGHHAVLYASTLTSYSVGETHECDTDDMLSISFLGAIGGEGTASNLAMLPAGLNFRLPTGRVLMINSHWVNATTEAVDGQAVIDVQFTDPDPSHLVADLFANNGDTFDIPAGQMYSYDVNCPIGADMNFAMVTNHMHGHGYQAMSEIIHADGTKSTTVQDDSWTPDMQFNPHYARFSVATPVPVKKGDVYHTRCTWENDGTTDLGFPTEMCAGVGFYFPGNGMVTCNDGGWPSGM